MTINTNTRCQAPRDDSSGVGKPLWLAAAAATAAISLLMLVRQMPVTHGWVQQPQVNRSLPYVAAPSRALAFSRAPQDGEFLRAGVFDQPLIPTGRSTLAENRALARALVEYHSAVADRGARDELGAVGKYVENYPASVWNAALLINMGAVYRETGHFSKALDTYTRAWAQTKALTDPNGRILGDTAVAQLSQFEAYLGRTELLAPLLQEIQGRPLHGTAAELVSDSSRGLGEMRNMPQFSFRCGPMALARILYYHGQHPPTETVRTLETSYSTDHGLPLSAVQEVSAKVGMHYQMAFRSRGAPVVYPAVVHWKLGHYAAIVDQIAGRYVVEDSTFGANVHVSPATLDEEGSGYFLIPPGPLPRGWRPVEKAEAEQVWGRGNTGSNTDFGDVGEEATPAFGDVFASNSECFEGCTSWNVEAMVVGLSLRDRPLGYTPPLGPPIKLTLQYSQRDALQPMAFAYSNLGNKWTFNWLSYITDKRSTNGTVDLYERGGGDEPFTFTSGATASQPGIYSQSVITVTIDSQGNATSFKRQLSDGSSETFGQPLGSQWFLTAVTDARGNAATLSYDSQFRLVGIKDAIGQATTLTYGLSSDPLKITKVTDPFGRSATFIYTSDEHLASVTDVLGITSSYTYGAADFVNTLTTPYGTTHFTYGDSTTDPSLANLGSERFVTATDTLGRTSRVEFRHAAPRINTSCLAPPNIQPIGMTTDCTLLEYRNTFIWDPQQLQLATGSNGQLDYTEARIYHWLHTAPDLGLGDSTSRVLESIVPPQGQNPENRVWFGYSGQQNYTIPAGLIPGPTVTGSSNLPTAIGHPLPGGATELQKFVYNAFGKITQQSDAVNRTTNFTYAANGIDLVSVTNGVNSSPQLLASYTYNSQHEPLTVTATNGKTSTFQYNSVGQPTQLTDALGNTTTFTYNGQGYLTAIQGPTAAASFAFTYDSFGRVASATDPAGMVISYSYDSADRLTRVAFPDGTSLQYAYHLLDLASSTDRLGQMTTLTFDSERQLSRMVDPAGNSVATSYTAAGLPASITDPNGNVTALNYDAAERLIKKQFADSSALTVQYETYSGRVGQTSSLSASGQTSRTVLYKYNADGSIYSYTATGGTGAATAVFTYDQAFPRLLGVAGQNGSLTTTFRYYPINATPPTNATPQLGANQLQSVTSNLGGLGLSTQSSGPDTVTYTYDELDRVVGRSVNGDTESFTYDALGRVVSAANPLDTFNYTYADATERIAGIKSAHGPALSLSYQPPSGDELLKQLQVTGPGGVALSQFNYTYNSNDLVTTFTESYLGQKLAAATGNLKKMDPKALAHFAGGGGASGMSHAGGAVGGGAFGMSTASGGAVGDGAFGMSTAGGGVGGGAFGTSTAGGAAGGGAGTGTAAAAGVNVGTAASAGGSVGAGAATLGLGASIAAVVFTPAGLQVVLLISSCGVLLIVVRRARLQRFAWALAPTVAALLVFGCGGGGGVGSTTNSGGGSGGSGSGGSGGTGGSGGSGSGGSGSGGSGGSTPSGLTTTYAYNMSDELISATPNSSSASSYRYAYDATSNLTAMTTGTQSTSFSFNSLNQLSGSGAAYDTDGNPTAAGSVLYTWDSLNRLASVSSGSGTTTKETDFGYDAFDHIVRIVQKTNSKVVSDYLFFWCGDERCAEHDNMQAGAPVTKQYFPQGMVSSGTGYYYVTDQLGSVRQLIDGSGNVRAQYQYDPYGARTKISGDQDSDIGYAGYFHEASSGLDFAMYRAYAAANGRWLNRDPIGESDDLNLYSYVGGAPTSDTDPTGQYHAKYYIKTKLSAKQVMGLLQKNPNRYFPFGVPNNSITLGSYHPLKNALLAPLGQGHSNLDILPRSGVTVIKQSPTSFTFKTDSTHFLGPDATVSFTAGDHSNGNGVVLTIVGLDNKGQDAVWWDAGPAMYSWTKMQERLQTDQSVVSGKIVSSCP